MLNRIKSLLAVVIYSTCIVLPLYWAFIFVVMLIENVDVIGVAIAILLGFPMVIFTGPLILSLMALTSTIFRHDKVEQCVTNIIDLEGLLKR